MTRKDYVLIARSLYYTRQTFLNEEEGEQAQAVLRAAEHIATALQNDNVRFDAARFLAAVREGK